jgi:hypothetical protein
MASRVEHFTDDDPFWRGVLTGETAWIADRPAPGAQRTLTPEGWSDR